MADPRFTDQEFVDTGFACGRHYLAICGFVVAVQGDQVREAEASEPTWTPRLLEEVAGRAKARLQEAEQERDRLAADNQRFREREDHFARALSVADGGQYRADWDGAIRRVLSDRDRLAQELAESQGREVERQARIEETKESRRIRRARALGKLDYILNVATRPYQDDPRSLEDLLDSAKYVTAVINEFEWEANDLAVSPSPAALAIGRVLEAALEFRHSSSRGYTGDPELQADFHIRLQDLDEAVDVFQSLRAGAREGK